MNSSTVKTSISSTLRLLKSTRNPMEISSAAISSTKVTKDRGTNSATKIVIQEKITVSEKTPKKTKIYPNVFLAFRVQNPEIISKISNIQAKLVSASKKFETKLTPVTALHITLFVAKMEDEEIPRLS